MAPRKGAQKASAKAAPKAAPKSQPSKKKLIEKAEASVPAQQVGQKRRLRREDTDDKVNRMLRDNFKGVPGECMDTVVHNGKTLRERLAGDLRAERADPSQKIARGKHYYSELKALYVRTKADDALVIRDLQQPENQQLKIACKLMHAHVRNFGPITEFLEWAPAVDQRNLVGLLLCTKALSPLASQVQAETIQDVMKYLVRTGLDKTFPSETAACLQHFDKAMQKTLSAYKASAVSVGFWWASVREGASLLLPVEDVDKCMNAEDKWSSVEAELVRICEASACGRLLFGFALEEVQYEKVSLLIEGHMQKLASRHITKAILHQQRGEFLADLAARNLEAHAVTSARDVVVTYRGAQVPLQVTSIGDEYAMQVAALVHGAAVDAGRLTKLWCEDDLLPRDYQPSGHGVDLDVVDKSALARKQAVVYLEEEGATTGILIKEVLQKRQCVLTSLDKAWRVEHAFFCKSIGEEGDARMRAEILHCLPNVGHALNADQVVNSLLQLGDGKLFQFVGKASQSLHSSVLGFAQAIQSKRAPKWAVGQAPEFIVTVKHRLGMLFVRHASGGADSAAAEYVGKAAATQVFGDIQEKMDNGVDVSLKDLEDLHIFAWLLEDAQASRLQKWTDIICAKSKENGSASRSSASITDKKKGAKKVSGDASSMVDAMFK